MGVEVGGGAISLINKFFVFLFFVVFQIQFDIVHHRILLLRV